MPIIAWIAYSLGLLPALWLAVRRVRAAEWWWLALAFGISWVADTVALASGHPWPGSALYPLAQTAVIAFVFLRSLEASAFVGILAVVTAGAILTQGWATSTLVVRTIAWGAIVSMVWRPRVGRLREALLVYFGLGWAAWMIYSLSPGMRSDGHVPPLTWTSWSLYQVMRAMGIGLFCWAAWKPSPSLRLV
jgi:hypothetical protein